VKIDDVIRNLEPHTPLDIRVMCPSGHFIANMTLSVRNGDLAIQGAHSKYDLQRKALQGKPALNAAVHAAPNWNSVLQCVNSDCTFRGYYNSQGLALELAEAALRARMAGHAEYRLTRSRSNPAPLSSMSAKR
jgi:hypothetical protein